MSYMTTTETNCSVRRNLFACGAFEDSSIGTTEFVVSDALVSDALESDVGGVQSAPLAPVGLVVADIAADIAAKPPCEKPPPLFGPHPTAHALAVPKGDGQEWTHVQDLLVSFSSSSLSSSSISAPSVSTGVYLIASEQTFCYYDLVTGEMSWKIPQEHPCSLLRASPDGQIGLLCRATLKPSFDVIDLKSGATLGATLVSIRAPSPRCAHLPSCATFSPDGKTISIAAGKSIWSFTLSDGAVSYAPTFLYQYDKRRDLTCIAGVSEHGFWCGDEKGVVTKWSLEGEPEGLGDDGKEKEGGEEEVDEAPTQAQASTVVGTKRKRQKGSVRKGGPMASLSLVTKESVWSLSVGGDLVVATQEHAVTVFDVDNGHLLWSISGDIRNASITQNGALLVTTVGLSGADLVDAAKTGGHDFTRTSIWNTSRWEVVQEIDHRGACGYISPDGQYLIVSEEGIRAWLYQAS